jgi:formate hydrogenlyase transcriptional activator
VISGWRLVGDSPALRETLHQVEIVAPTDSTVLLLGETGTGKELLAWPSKRPARLFLDEVGEIPLELSRNFSASYRSRNFERIGGTKSAKVNVRIIAATNRDLREMVEKQRFRDDLFYRLNVFPIHVPPLRASMAPTRLGDQATARLRIRSKCLARCGERGGTATSAQRHRSHRGLTT